MSIQLTLFGVVVAVVENVSGKLKAWCVVGRGEFVDAEQTRYEREYGQVLVEVALERH